jgi:hypothetical protein
MRRRFESYGREDRLLDLAWLSAAEVVCSSLDVQALAQEDLYSIVQT